jgi:integrase
VPRKGYRSITLPDDIYSELMDKARVYGASPQKTIKMLMEDSNSHVNFDEAFSLKEKGSAAAFATSSNRDWDLSSNESKRGFKNGSRVALLPECTVQLLCEFEKFCSVDLGLAPRTVDTHIDRLSNVFRAVGPDPTVEQLRSFLSTIENPSSFNNHLKALHAYYRDFKHDDSLIKTFRWRRCECPPHQLFSRGDLTKFKESLTPNDAALFLMLASTGRRFGEIISLRWPEIDLDSRTLQPNHFSRTKRSYYSFFNRECQDALVGFEPTDKEEGRIFTSSLNHVPWRYARIRSGLSITPQDLRFWFSNEMARLGVADRFIDAFQGRIPRSVLARHYTDYSLDNLKQVYEKAGLKVLEK